MTSKKHKQSYLVPPQVSIVVVSWNCREILKLCLDSILASTLTVPSIQTIVVDNNSADDTVNLVRDQYPWVDLVESSENLGFAGGNNLGFKYAQAENILLLNPDAYFPAQDTLARMLDYLNKRADISALGCQLTYPDGKHQVGDAGYRPTPLSVAFYALGLTRFIPVKGLFIVNPDSKQGKPVNLDWICGACFLVRRRVIDEVGGLNESLFMYAEDVEWGCRIRDYGHKIHYLPFISVIHIQGGTQYKNEEQIISTKWLDSLAEVYKILNDGQNWQSFRYTMTLGFAMRAVAYRLMSRILRRNSLQQKARAMTVYARHIWQMPSMTNLKKSCE